jgi:hypothetical protein
VWEFDFAVSDLTPVGLLRIRYKNRDALRLLSGQVFDDAREALSVLPDGSA